MLKDFTEQELETLTIAMMLAEDQESTYAFSDVKSVLACAKVLEPRSVDSVRAQIGEMAPRPGTTYIVYVTPLDPDGVLIENFWYIFPRPDVPDVFACVLVLSLEHFNIIVSGEP
jgi:hypothetical protein